MADDRIDRIAPDGDKPDTIDLSIDVEQRDPDNPDAPATIVTRTETFELGKIPPVLIMKIAGAKGGSSAAVDQYDGAVWDLLTTALKDDQELVRFERFAIEVDASRPQITDWISAMIAAITALPTSGQSDSPTGLPETEATSTEPGDSKPETPAPQGSAL